MTKTYSWTGASSFGFEDPENWVNQATGMPDGGVPGALDTADVSGTGGFTGSGTLAALNDVASSAYGTFTDGASITATQFSDQGIFEIADRGALATGSATVSSGTTGEALLEIGAGGTLSGINGTLALSVSGSSNEGGPSLFVSAMGSLALGGGTGIIGTGNDQAGTAFVDGDFTGAAGSGLIVGQSGGTGTVSLQQGGTLSLAGSLILGDGGIGVATLTTGSSMTLGSGSNLALVVGQASQFAFSIDAEIDNLGGSLDVDGQAEIGEACAGAVMSDGGTLTTSDGLTLGVLSDGAGTLSLAANTAWLDTGNVVVGSAGFGMLELTGDETGEPNATIDGDVLVGASGGSGTISVTDQVLRVEGPTTLGSQAGFAGPTSIFVQQAGVWDSSGQTVTLAGGNYSITVFGAGSALRAGMLAIGRNAAVSFSNSASGTLGSSAGATAISISGSLDCATGADVTATGGVTLSGLAQGLSVEGTLAIDATGQALTIGQNTVATVDAAGALLSATGGILVQGSDSQIAIAQGTVSASSVSGPALLVEGGARLALEFGTLQTAGEFILGDAVGALVSGGGAMSSQNMSITSTASAADMPAVLISSADDALGEARLIATTWTIMGDTDIGTTGHGELTETEGSSTRIHGTLTIGSATGIGIVSADGKILSGLEAHLGAGVAGIGAADIVLQGAGSELSGTSLQVGAAQAGAHLAVSAGTVAVTGDATIFGGVALSDGGTLAAGGTLAVKAYSTILGAGTLSAVSIVDNGRIGATGGTMVCIGPITGDGTLSVRDGTLVLEGGESAGVGMLFGPTGTLSVASPASIAGSITHFGLHDAIDFTGVQIASLSYAHHTLSLFDSAGHLLGTEEFTGIMTSHNFTLSADQGAGTLLSYHG